MAKAIPNCSIQLGVSKIPDAGIGVFAIIPISKGEYPFVSEEAAPSILISESEFVKAPSYIQKLILHYCEIHNDGYYVPSDFRHIDASWFLNHSDNPNIDSTLLTALRDIKPGEELTVNYHGPPIN
ncbi:MAG: SET domain-containing protein-lysine N-methyltransferase, partial [Methanotrichaceae archaeon]